MIATLAGRLPRKTALCLWILASWAGSAAAQVTQRVNLSSSGNQARGDSEGSPVSADGRYVAFGSNAANLVPGDTNGLLDVFVRDRQTGTTERVSVDSSGAEANGKSGLYGLSISGDGRFVAFVSEATNLSPGDMNGKLDVFVRDRQLGLTECASVDPNGATGNGDSGSYGFAISADGRYVAFASSASNLVAGDTPALDVFVQDRQLGLTEIVSVNTTGGSANGQSYHPSISSDGHYVAFVSTASNLVQGDTNAHSDVFVRDRILGMIDLISVDSSGAQANGDNFVPSISADGRCVAFESDASNLVAGETNFLPDIFLHDRQIGTTERISVDSSGVQGLGFNVSPRISSDGRYVAFTSDASNLVPGDTNGDYDIFVRDRQLGTTERMSVDSSGMQANDFSGTPWISADGRFVTFYSLATNLVAGDTNAESDIFVRDRLGGPDFTNLCDPGISGVLGCPCGNPPSGSGRGCDNSAITGGAVLTATGGTYLSSDSLLFTTSGQAPATTSVLMQGTSPVATGLVYGQGVRCVGGTLKRLFTKTAHGGGVTVPDFGAGDPQVSARAAAKGDAIGAGESRWYLVFYRDPVVLGGCPSGSTFNATQTGQITWSP